MLFNSIHYLFFLPVVIIFYFLLPYKYRWILLLIASYYFYMCWRVEYIILIIVSTVIDYTAAIMIHRLKGKRKKKLYLLLSLASNLGLLFVFKYFNFFTSGLNEVFKTFNILYTSPSFKLLLPVGISFYTFQTLSYTIDVYRGKKEPEKHFGIFSLYVSFFPQLVAGPIERSTHLLPQFKKNINFEYRRVADGLKLIGWGLFKKVVIADRLGMLINPIYSNPSDNSGLALLVSTVFFAFQIFCDFSGYSDIAIGSAQIMGFDLMDNFNRPYFARSLRDFWNRWHISLSTWFKDYVYIPLGGNRAGKGKWLFNLFLTFLLSGFWHGANWTFIAWGSLHGLYLIFGIVLKKISSRVTSFVRLNKAPVIHKYLQVGFVFSLVTFAWIFFRANSIGDAFFIIKKIFSDTYNFTFQSLNMVDKELFISIVAIAFMEIIHKMQKHDEMRSFITKKPLCFRWTFYFLIVLGIILFGIFDSKQFIYFQF